MRMPGLLIVILAHASLLHAGEQTFCELYAPGHFGNWYEVAGEREMRGVLTEARAWGYTRYGDWFDTLDCVDPFADDGQYDLANALWDRKKTHFQTAQSLGLETDLIITPNHVYRGQLEPEWLAETGGRVFGQLICPHQPGVRDQILENYRKLFSDLAGAGVCLTAITPAPYDYGGCNCERCRPWIVTFADLSCAIYDVARTLHPGVALHFIGWWWSEEEHRQFAEWMDRNAPDRTVSIALHIPYGRTTVSSVPLPRNCRRHAFVHIGYAEEASPRDVYGRTGPVIAADRLARTVRDLKEQSVTGVVAYTEGIHDDINKALLAGLFSDRFTTADDVLLNYAERYLSATPSQAREWADWLRPWGKPFDVDARQAREDFRTLCGDRFDWRRRQWELKTDLFVAHHQIGTGDQWTTVRLAHVEDFWTAHEELNRGVYGLGPLRHILGPHHIGLPWYRSWSEHRRGPASRPCP